MLNLDSLVHKDLLETLFENSYNSIAITDANLELPGPQFVYVNPAFTKKTGYTLDDLKGKTPRILQGEETNSDILKELKEKCRKGEYFQGSTVNYRKDGTKYHVEWNISPIKDKNAEITHYISIQRDITTEVEYKKVLQEKIEQQKKDLELKDTIVSQQTRLALMGEMIDSIAHQWKQPLNIINISSELLLYAYEDDKLDELYIETYQDKVRNQVKHMDDTLNEFRSFLRPNKCKSFFKVKKMLESIKVLLKDELDKCNIKLIILVKDDFEIYGIENEFKHVLINMINNSKDAFIQNKIENREILIEASRVKDISRINYQDNAGGIPKSIIEKIFDINFTTKEQLNGSGIGLYMSKKILDKHKAKIDVKSEKSNTYFKIDIEND